MSLLNKAYSKFLLLNIAEKLIVINILFFVFPYLINGIMFLFGLQNLNCQITGIREKIIKGF